MADHILSYIKINQLDESGIKKLENLFQKSTIAEQKRIKYLSFT